MLARGDQFELLTAMEALGSVSAAQQLVDCVRSTVRPLIPHEIFVFGAGAVKGHGFTDYKPLGYRFPLGYLDDVRQPDGAVCTPSIARFIETAEPQLFESATYNKGGRKKAWLQAFDRYDLHNMAAHGVIDRRKQSATFFSFFQVSDRLGERQARILKLLAPHLHLALERCVPELPSQHKLSAQQLEIVKYLYLGKTNWEIASILGLSERNAKYHVEEIIRKLDVVNRTEAAAKAAKLGLVSVD